MLQDRVVLITGGLSGMGLAAAELFVQSKAKVFAVGRPGQDLPNLPQARFQTLERDIQSADDGQAIAKAALDAYGQVDVLIHLAGQATLKPAKELDDATFVGQLNDNFLSAVRVTQALLPHFEEQKAGTILFVPGIVGKVPLAGGAAYVASKHALVGYAKALREDLKRTKVQTSCLFFGGVDSPFWDDAGMKVARDRLIALDDAARAVWFAAQQPPSGVMSELVLQPFVHQAI